MSAVATRAPAHAGVRGARWRWGARAEAAAVAAAQQRIAAWRRQECAARRQSRWWTGWPPDSAQELAQEPAVPAVELDAALQQALEAAGAVSAVADTKAGHLLTASGVLLTGVAVLATANTWTAPVAVLLAVAGAGLAAAVLALVAVLDVRGGSATVWLLPGGRDVDDQLAVVAAIVTRKHTLLRLATRALAIAVLAGAAATLAAIASGVITR